MTSRRLRILYVQPNSEVGGADLALLRLVESLDLTIYEPHVVMPNDGPMAPRLATEGARVHFMPMMQLPTLSSPLYQVRYLMQFWPVFVRLRKLILANDIEIVHTNSLYSLYGGFAAWFAARPHIWHVREVPPQISLARPALAAMTLTLSRIVISMTDACTRGLFAAEGGRKIRLLAEGMDLAKWARGPTLKDIRTELGLSPQALVVGFVARLDSLKRLDVFIGAAALVGYSLRDVVSFVSGDAPAGFERHREDMIARAAKLGMSERIKFLGWRYRMDDILSLMASLDIFCHTSIQPEPFGLVIIEAMAMECPVIAARTGGPLEIIEDGVSGLLTTPRDAAALALAIGGLLTARERRCALAAAGRLRVEQKFSRVAFARALDRVYRNVRSERSA